MEVQLGLKIQNSIFQNVLTFFSSVLRFNLLFCSISKEIYIFQKVFKIVYSVSSCVLYIPISPDVKTFITPLYNIVKKTKHDIG